MVPGPFWALVREVDSGPARRCRRSGRRLDIGRRRDSSGGFTPSTINVSPLTRSSANASFEACPTRSL